MINALRSLNFVVRHPLNRHDPLKAIGRVVAWQIATRLRPGAVAVPFVEGTRLLVSRGMTGATGNVYCGLHEFEDMAFVLHALRPGDQFVDIGANIGSYTILAAGVAGARVLAFEPAPRAYRTLLDNLRLNDLVQIVEARNEGVGAQTGRLRFTTDLDTVNHVAAHAEQYEACVDVPICTLDAALGSRTPSVIKVDVEGYESAVVEGAERTLCSKSVMAVLMELNGSGLRYGFDEQKLHRRMLAYGFTAASYEPLARKLTANDLGPAGVGNLLYLRDLDAMQRRVSAAPRRAVHGNFV